MKWRAFFPQILVFGISLLLIIAVHISVPTVIQSVLSFAFLLYCPGIAYVWLLDLEDHLSISIYAIALSIALDIIVSEGLILLKVWSSNRALYILVGITLIGVFLKTLITLRQRAELAA